MAIIRSKRSMGLLIDSQSGSAILMSLIVAVLVVIALGAFAQMMNQSLEFQKQRDRKGDYLAFVGAVRNNILNPYLCTRALRGRPVSAVPLVPSLSLPFTPPNPVTGGAIFQNVSLNLSLAGVTTLVNQGWTAPGGRFTISQVRLATVAGPVRAIRYDIPVSPLYRTYLMRLYLVPGDIKLKFGNRNTLDRTGTQVTYENKDYFIEFYANVGPTNRIFSCHGVESDAALCEAAGGAFYPDEIFPSRRCHPWNRCWTSQAGLVNTPTSCLAQPFTQVMHVGRVGATNKYLCNWCNRNL